RWSPADWGLHVHHSDRAVTAACTAAGLHFKNCFHFGYPLLQLSHWEGPSLLYRVLYKAQRAQMAVGWVVPIYHYGLRQVSGERGFVAQKPITDAGTGVQRTKQSAEA